MLNKGDALLKMQFTDRKALRELLELERLVRHPAASADRVDDAYQKILKLTEELRKDSKNSRKFQRIPIVLTVTFDIGGRASLVSKATDFSLGGFRMIQRMDDLESPCLLVNICIAHVDYAVAVPCQLDDDKTHYQGVKFLGMEQNQRYQVFEAFDYAYMTFLDQLVGDSGIK